MPAIALTEDLVLQRNSVGTTPPGEHWRVRAGDRCILAGEWAVAEKHEGIVFHFCCESCLTGLTYRLIHEDLVAWCRGCSIVKPHLARPRIIHRYAPIDRIHLTDVFERVLLGAGLDPLTAGMVASHLVDLVPHDLGQDGTIVGGAAVEDER